MTAPTALRPGQSVTVTITLPIELHLLAEVIESRACFAAANPATIAVADDWFDRAAELRAAAR